jgi:hypothetical protein
VCARKSLKSVAVVFIPLAHAIPGIYTLGFLFFKRPISQLSSFLHPDKTNDLDALLTKAED